MLQPQNQLLGAPLLDPVQPDTQGLLHLAERPLCLRVGRLLFCQLGLQLANLPLKRLHLRLVFVMAAGGLALVFGELADFVFHHALFSLVLGLEETDLH